MLMFKWHAVNTVLHVVDMADLGPFLVGAASAPHACQVSGQAELSYLDFPWETAHHDVP